MRRVNILCCLAARNSERERAEEQTDKDERGGKLLEVKAKEGEDSRNRSGNTKGELTIH